LVEKMPKKGGGKDKDAGPPKPKGEFDAFNKEELAALIVQLRHDKAVAEQQVGLCCLSFSGDLLAM